MKLCVPANWDETLYDALRPFPVHELYGSLPETLVGGGRPSFLIRNIPFDILEKHISAVHKNGWRFNYLLNSSCTANLKSDAVLKNKLLRFLDTLQDLSIDSITVATPFLISFIKHHFPNITCKASIFLMIDSTEKARQIEAFGADTIKIFISKNRDFRFLYELRKAVNCELTLLVNQGCLYACPYTHYHGNINAHASTTDSSVTGPMVMNCLIKCTLQKLRNPAELLRSRWIRPEDIAIYENYGYELFKIAGREMSTERILRTVKAYADRTCSGNLLDIINGVTVLEGLPSKMVVPDLKSPVLRNDMLEGFIDHFTAGKCPGECSSCSYCNSIAEKAVSVFPEENEQLLDILEYFGQNMLSIEDK
jgi:collagenase-like PrtC family protease